MGTNAVYSIIRALKKYCSQSVENAGVIYWKNEEYPDGQIAMDGNVDSVYRMICELVCAFFDASFEEDLTEFVGRHNELILRKGKDYVKEKTRWKGIYRKNFVRRQAPTGCDAMEGVEEYITSSDITEQEPRGQFYLYMLTNEKANSNGRYFNRKKEGEKEEIKNILVAIYQLIVYYFVRDGELTEDNLVKYTASVVNACGNIRKSAKSADGYKKLPRIKPRDATVNEMSDSIDDVVRGEFD